MKSKRTPFYRAAINLVQALGYTDAHKEARRRVKDNAMGTASHAFNVAILKEIERFATVGRIYRHVRDVA